jgi:hypothetical protein
MNDVMEMVEHPFLFAWEARNQGGAMVWDRILTMKEAFS